MSNMDLKERAFALCKLRGIDPDEIVICSHPEGYAVALKRYRWALVMEEIKTFLELLEVTRDGN